jgi:hypothetical protein
MLDLVRRAGQARLVLVPTHCGSLTGSAADLTDIFVVEDPEESRSQIRSHLPEVKLSERSRQALLDEVVCIDRIMRQTARISSKVGKYAFDIPVQHGLRGIALFIRAGGFSRRCRQHHLAACRFLAIAHCILLSRLGLYELELWQDSAFRLASHENLRMMSLSCSTIVALFHLLSSVLMAMTASSAIVASSNL